MKIQNYRNKNLFNSYEDAVKYIETTLIYDTSIVDGEEIYIRYKSDNTINTLVVAAYVENDKITLNIINEGLSIIESKTMPSPKYQSNHLWLETTNESPSIIENDVISDLKSMQQAISELIKIVNRHEYAFNNVMDCGKVTDTNSTRQTLMQEAIPEAPQGYEDGSEPILLMTYDGINDIAQITDFYLKSQQNSSITTLHKDWDTFLPTLDETNKFLWNYRVVKLTNGNEIITTPNVITQFNNSKILNYIEPYYFTSNTNEIPNKKENTYQTTLPTLSIEKPFIWNYMQCVYLRDENEDKPSYESSKTPNIKHLLIKSAESEQEIQNNLLNLLDNELIWCEGNNGLYIKTKGKIVKINGNNNNNNNNNENIEEIMSGITFDSNYVSTIDFISSKGNVYRMKIDDEKGLIVYKQQMDDLCPAPTEEAAGKPGDFVTALNSAWEKLYINSLYCGGITDENGNEINEHSLNYCSHNFIELSNLTNNDINLNGMSIQYTDSGSNWHVLPLWGTIKSKSTFLIRGAQCSIMNANTTVIKVKEYDMIWNDSTTSQPIKFSNKSAKFYLTYGTTPCNGNTPYTTVSQENEDGTSSTIVKILYGYIDLIGINNGSGVISGAYEGKGEYQPIERGSLLSNYIFKKYYSMDNVSQATKALDKRNNSADWYLIDLRHNDILPNILDYTPKSSASNKNLFYNKTNLLDLKPSVVNISFGIQATANEDLGATRCFNWVSKGLYDEYLWYSPSNEESWTMIESYKGNQNTELISNNGGKHGYQSPNIGKYYYRITQESSNGEVFTAHKVILRNLQSGEYKYICGKKNHDNTPNMEQCSDIRTFIVRSTQDVIENGYKFFHVSDQQGFNWDEYQVWRYAAQYIANYNNIGDNVATTLKDAVNAHFMINTGDMTQNGNRLNEWLDYFNGKEPISFMEEMATIGNNDLCPKIPYELGDGGDASKLNFVNITFFYTYELDETLDENGLPIYAPIFNIENTQQYIPSIYSFIYGDTHFICVNSEISEKCEKTILGLSGNTGQVYEKVRQWCENDWNKHSGCTWHIAYCHEMPFTIITDTLVGEFYDSKNNTEDHTKHRGGSRINTVTKSEDKYWFSRFCQEHNIRLVMGGHKHTQAITHPIKENVTENGQIIDMKPIIEVTTETLKNDFNASGLTQITDESNILYGYSYPSSWFNTNGQFKTDYEINAHLCTFELVEKITAPIYSMSQSTGYKHTSNKELPSVTIPWSHYYYPNNNGSVNSDQIYPFFTIVSVNKEEIHLDVRRIQNILQKGKFNINSQGVNINSGKVTIYSENGIASGEQNNTTSIIITK